VTAAPLNLDEEVRLSVVVPVFNERDTILSVLRRLDWLELPVELEVIVIDDGSTDGTTALLRDLPPRAYRHVQLRASNGGKGTAVRDGLACATGDYVIVQDADLEVDPEDIARLLEPVLAQRARIVCGSRYLDRPAQWLRAVYWANRGLTALANLLFGVRLSDVGACYKLFPTALLRSFELTSTGFELETEITAKALVRGLPIHEIPIAYRPRTRAEGKKIEWRDGLSLARTMVSARVRPLAPALPAQAVRQTIAPTSK